MFKKNKLYKSDAVVFMHKSHRVEQVVRSTTWKRSNPYRQIYYTENTHCSNTREIGRDRNWDHKCNWLTNKVRVFSSQPAIPFWNWSIIRAVRLPSIFYLSLKFLQFGSTEFFILYKICCMIECILRLMKYSY